MGYISANLELLSRYAEDLAHFGHATQTLARNALAGEQDPGAAWLEFTRERADLDMDYILRDLNALVRECHEGAERIRDIVGNLRAYSHPNERDWGESNLHEGIESALNIVRGDLKNRCTLVRDYGQLPRVWCLPQQLNQVFLNLLLNAAQAIPERGTITVRTRARGDRVAVEVVDTGTGIASENLKRIFDPFFTTKPVGKGTGLGLHLALGIVQKHDGELRVTSAPGQGSTFSVVLPVDPRKAKESGSADA
jgi:signal transduction histidine kinase